MTGPASRAVAPPAAALLSSLSAVFPVRDEEANVVGAAEDLLAVLPSVAERWEVVIVDDASRDGTAALVDALARTRAGVRVVRLPASRGYGTALRAGLAAARGEYVFLTDGDRQFEARELARLVPALAAADLVVGYRARRADPLGRRVGGRLWNALVRALLGLPVRDVNCAFKLIRREALHPDELSADGAAVSAELLAVARRHGARIVEVPVTHRPRVAGQASGGSLRVALRGVVEVLALARRVGRARP